MAAGLGFKTFTTGEVLTAADVNGYLMQGILVFANATARDAAITSPQEGQCCYLKDTDAVLTYSGSAWVGFDDSNAIQNSIINAKGDLISGSANDTPAILSVGSDGSTLVADSSASVGLRYQEPKAGNPVINSAFQVWQRGTSISIAASTNTGYSADRWASISAANQASTVSRQVTNDTTNLPNIQYCARVQRNSGQTGTGKYYFNQAFETINTIPFVGKTVTLSFYARAGANYSPTSSALEVWLVTQTGTDQNLGAYTNFNTTPINGTATLTTTWQRFSFTGTIATTATEMAISLNMTPTGTASTNDYFEVTGVQLEVGSVATPFKTQGVTLAGELAACQRYYYRVTPQTTNSPYGIGNTYSSTITTPILHLPTVLRTTPAIETSGTAGHYSIQQGGSSYTCNAVPTINQTGVQVIQLQANVASGLTAGQVAQMYSLSTSGYIGFSAEL